MSWLAAAPSFRRFLLVELWLSSLYASYKGATAVWLTEIMPADVRAADFSLAYNLAPALFGGFTPGISTDLIHATGNAAMGGIWLTIAAGCGLTAALFGGRQFFADQGGLNLACRGNASPRRRGLIRSSDFF